MIHVPELDHHKTVEEILTFIRQVIIDAKARGIVIGLSGGVDSSLTATLCVQALGQQNVLGILMPIDFTPHEDMEDAQEFAEKLGIDTRTINIRPICESFFHTLEVNTTDTAMKIIMGNIIARVRMIILYYYANLHNYLVVGPSDRSEALIGFFTKYGDGGADFYPCIHLYKTQMRNLAKYLNLPRKIAEKPSSPQLYPGHKATDEIPLAYAELDPLLVGLFDQKLSPEVVSQQSSVSIPILEDILQRFHRSHHKRTFPPTIKNKIK
jgi:NAD+ synthase